MNLRTFAVFAVLAITLSIRPLADEPKTNEQRVRDYVTAFNERKIDQMLAMVTDDVQWLTVEGDKISVETAGKEPLRESMTKYFKSTTTKSTLEWVQPSKARVAALEKASWESKSSPRAQSSLSIYEFRGALIARVYYYPAEK